jgi:hypothetical protein
MQVAYFKPEDLAHQHSSGKQASRQAGKQASAW